MHDVELRMGRKSLVEIESINEGEIRFVIVIMPKYYYDLLLKNQDGAIYLKSISDERG